MGVPSRGTGIALFSDCKGDRDTQLCLHHFMSDGDIWNARTSEFDIDPAKVPCAGTQATPEGSSCVFNGALADAQNYRRIAKQIAGAANGAVVQNYHTMSHRPRDPAYGSFTVEVSFLVTEDTAAWCDATTGDVVSFTNLQITQTRNAGVPEGVKVVACEDATATLFTEY